MKITQKHWASLRITGYTASEYLVIKTAAVQAECRIIFEKRTLVIAGTSLLTAIKQLETFKQQLA